MTNSTQRIVLLSGASLAALGIANPAFAAVVPFPPSATYPIVAPAINDVLIISLIGDPAATYGVDVVGNGVVSASVTSDVNGQITQSGTATVADAIFLATNAGVVTVRADALASGAAALQSADADVSAGFSQLANGAKNASVTFNNSGSLTIGAFADAIGDTAVAAATIKSGIHQEANANDGNATVALTNSGTLAVNALANAVADVGNASADAQIKSGISQSAQATDGIASVTLTNASTGIIDLRAVAAATATNLLGTGGNANATATLSDAINQYASATGGFLASTTLTNAGVIRLYGDATAVADGFANATADNENAFDQSARAIGGGNAVVSLDNSAVGLIDIRAKADGFGAGASASAYVSGAINQNANASSAGALNPSGDGTIGLTNAATGSISIVAQATAVGTETGATANATVFQAVQQDAFSNDGDATVGLTNAGTLTINAAALATATAGDGATSSANANGYIETGISQQAFTNGGAATVTLTNSGTLNLTASAGAIANTVANASASVSTAISQSATAYGGDAKVDLTNSGTLRISSNANATGTIASADASINTGIQQSASAFLDGVVSGNAIVTLTNASSGTINFTANALANASIGNADASASISSAISQEAFASRGNASTTVTNAGILTITALGTANSTNLAGDATGSAEASASATGGIYQSADARIGGNATATVINSGTFTYTATANALADGYAESTATASSGISQSANAYGGGDATALLTNSGTINQSANAKATGSQAQADASLDYGISQSAYAYNSEVGISGDAFTTITNASTGVINLNANATAVASNNVATASASVSTAIYQNAYSAAGNATSTLTNSGALTIGATAKATSTGAGLFASNSAFAYASIETGIEQSASAAGPGGIATATITNSGALTIAAKANANAADYAYATATVSDGISQTATANVAGTAAVSLTNSAALNITADAVANGGTGASASGTVDGGIYQDAFVGGAGNASVALTNATTGVLTIRGSAVATATAGSASASAYVSSGISQNVDAIIGIGSAIVTNNGTINIIADANGTGTSNADAYASVDSAIYQDVNGAAGATATVVNTGTFAVAARADAAGSTVSATAYIDPGIEQNARSSAGNATSSLTNSGTLTFVSHAGAVAASSYASANAYLSNAITQSASAPTGDATVSVTNSSVFTAAADANATSTGDAYATAHVEEAIYQSASAGAVDGLATASIVNSGTLTLSADAEAHGGATVGGSGTVQATAYITGISQNVSGFDGVLTLNNSGTLTVKGDAVADGGDYGYASATVTGVAMRGNATNSNTINFTNTSAGKFIVIANASATGLSSSTAFASAQGLTVNNGPQTLAVSNVGQFKVNANATASSANAYAYGMSFANGVDGVLKGTVTNGGTLTVAAVADGSSTSSASAVGITFFGDVNNVTATNTGTIDVLAQTNGGSAEATGVRATNNGAGVPGLADKFTFTNNGGTVSARISTDSGDTFQRGMAIDVANALGQSVINFTGAGDIYGNVDVKALDVINVFAGETSFDGVINPECLPPIKDGISATCGDGVLNIGAGGTLYLRDTRNTSPDTFDGPAYAFVEIFNVAATGTLAYDLPTNSVGGTQPLGSYPQIFTNVANLAGTIEVRPASENGLYDDTYFFDNVIDAVTMNGTFANCNVAGGTPLLSLECVYDGLENLDLRITRNDFIDIPGLDGNGTGVAIGLDCLYSNDLTGGIGALVAELFTLDTPGLLAALPQLSAAPYASYLQSFNKLGVRYNDLLDQATNCENPALAGSVLECRTNPIHLWGQIQGGTRKQDGDVFAGDVDGDQWTAMIGVDAAVAPAIVLGVSLGKVSNRIDTGYGARVKGDGYLLGGYAVYDPGNFYAKLIGTYANIDGEGRREVDFRPFGGTIFGDIGGSPDVRMWTAGAHFGYRIAMGASALTPYLNYDHVSTKLKSFVERGLEGANLAVRGKEKHDFVTAGAKYAIDVGGAVLEADLGWQHMFGQRRAGVSTAFSADLDCLFDSYSAAEKRDSIKAGLSLGGKVMGLDVRAGYSGLFSGSEKNHAGSFKIVLPFGGARR